MENELIKDIKELGKDIVESVTEIVEDVKEIVEDIQNPAVVADAVVDVIDESKIATPAPIPVSEPVVEAPVVEEPVVEAGEPAVEVETIAPVVEEPVSEPVVAEESTTVAPEVTA